MPKFHRSAGFKKHAYYGKGTGNITLSHLQCNGLETDISDCKTGHPWAKPYSYCTHDDDVSVECG